MRIGHVYIIVYIRVDSEYVECVTNSDFTTVYLTEGLGEYIL